MKTVWKLVLLVLLPLAAFTAGFQAHTWLTPPAAEELPREFGLLKQVWDILNEEYVNQSALDPEKLSRGAAKGMLEALDDPYTAFLDPEAYKLQMTHLHGKFEGIGAHVSMKEGELIVIAPIPGTPAEKAGLRAGDRILEVDGVPIKGMSLNEAVLRIRGPKGTKVRLLVLHEGETRPVEIEIVRGEIKLPSIRYMMRDDGIAYLRIFYFSDQTFHEVERALKELMEKQPVGLILDLRSNPGGYLAAVVAVADQFLKGGVVVYELQKGGERKPWNADPEGLALDVPLAVLVNKYSASGSEVLAGALQDYGRALIVGTTTFGKGSVNVLYPLSGDSALYLTKARWLTPKGRQIEGKGIVPDVTVEITPEDYKKGRDPQLEYAVEYLLGRVNEPTPSP